MHKRTVAEPQPFVPTKRCN